MTFENVFANPATEVLSQRAGEPVVVSVNGDAWISTRHKKYAELLVERYAGTPFALTLLNALQKEGLILRFVLRSQFFNGYELDRTPHKSVNVPSSESYSKCQRDSERSARSRGDRALTDWEGDIYTRQSMFARTTKPTTRKRVPTTGTSRVGGVCVLDA